jgi:uncharacterized protein involved in outer membrane biogenesis
MQIFSLRLQLWLRWGLIALLFWLLLWVLGWLALPPLLRALGEKLATERLGRVVQLGAIDFRPWSLQLTLHDIRIAGRQPELDKPLLQVQRLHLDADWQSLRHLAPVLTALEIDAPVLHLTQQAAGRWDIDDIMARLQAQQPAPDTGPPAAFALHNVVLRGGAIEFQDDTIGRAHSLRALQVQIPSLSNLPTQRMAKVQPQLAFELNGSRFESTTQATPFAPQPQAEMLLRWSGLDLKPYLAYLPASLPVRVQSALLDAELRVQFAQAAPEATEQKPMLRLSGHLAAYQLQLHDAAQAKLLFLERLTLDIEELLPLERRVQLRAVRLESPQVRVHRDLQGQLNWLRLTSSATPSSKKTENTHSSTMPWQFQLEQLSIQKAQVDWQDDSLATPARLALRGLALQATQIAWPLQQPVPFSGQMQLSAPRDQHAPAQLAFTGKANQHQAQLALSVKALPLAWGRPYLAASLLPHLDGLLHADVGLAWNGPNMVAQIAQLSLDDVELACAPQTDCQPATAPSLALRSPNSLAELKKLQLQNTQIHLGQRRVTVESMALTQPRLLLERNSAGRWMFEPWLPPAQPPTVSTVSAASAAPAPAPPWSVQWQDLALHGGSVAFRDGAAASAVALMVSGLQVQLKNFAPLDAQAAPATLNLSARIGAGRTEPGRLQYDGSLALAPLAVQGQLQAQQLPLHVLVPYVAHDLNMDIRRADGSFEGQINYAQTAGGPQVKLAGDAALDDVRVRTLATEEQAPHPSLHGPWRIGRAENLLNWKSLAVRGLSVALVPDQPLQVEVRETALADFFARVVIEKDGHLNLQNWRKTPAASATAPASTAIATTATTPPAPIIRIGPITLSGGRVDFSDYFIQPNYSADLSGLAGRLSAFSSVPAAPGMPPQMADLELRGRAQGTAALQITGQLNPLVQPLALNIRGQMHDLELPPLSPYTVKYAGHGIERGKLNMDIHYQVQADGQLTAGNKLVLHQLKFGDPVEGAPTSLPLRLVTALLADRNGVINVDLPINGSLNDPEFRLGAVIFKLVGNLITKAVTAPFSLLAGLFSGAEEQGSVAFDLGTPQLTPAARQSLDKIAQAMQERPALNMTVVGQASADAEDEAWRQARLQEMVQAQKRRQAVRAGQAAQTVTPVSAEEYPLLLKEVYRRADLKKERNLIGMAKDVPVAQMEAVLLGSIHVPDNAMRELALARAVAVRDYLATRDLPLERLFLGAPKTVPAQADWTPQAALSLAVR